MKEVTKGCLDFKPKNCNEVNFGVELQEEQRK